MKRNLKRLMVAIVQICAIAGFAATPTVTGVVAKQRYPWRLVDITCKVSGIDGTADGLWFSVSAVMSGSGSRNVSHFLVVGNGPNSNDIAVHTNGEYRLLWDAQADLGSVSYSNMVIRVTVVGLHGNVRLWGGGPYWANTNIGAEKPEEYGYYFSWGDVIGCQRGLGNGWGTNDGSNALFSNWNSSTYKKSIATLKSEGWITANEVLTSEHDAAHVWLGGNWRMPTRQELDDLVSKCDWNWTTINGVYGYVVRGKGDFSSARIFLPAAGYGKENSLYYAGSEGCYWSSVPDSYNEDSRLLCFWSGGAYTRSDRRYLGYPVRPVR